MPKRIIFFFPPTLMPGTAYVDNSIEDSFSDDVIRVYLNHCGDANIGNGVLFPDFEIVAKKIKSAFDDSSKLSVLRLQQQLGTGISKIEGLNKDEIPANPVTIERICIQGYSRGAVAAFAVANQLNELNLPIDLIADRPVPGQFTQWIPASLFSKYHDLSHCNNIRSITTIFAAHHLKNDFFHNVLFKQMLPIYPKQARINTVLIPHDHHFRTFRDHPVSLNIAKELDRLGYFKPAYVDQSTWNARLHAYYESNEFLYFTPEHYRQTIFGTTENILKDPCYREVIKKEAQQIITAAPFNQNPNIALSAEMASAIGIIQQLAAQDKSLENNKINFIGFILANTPEAKVFCKIVNEVHGCCVFLSHITQEENNTINKSYLITKHSLDYKRTIFTDCYRYLSDPDKTDKKRLAFINSVKHAQQHFETNALSIDRGIARKALCIVTNGILLLTGLFIFANTLNKFTTGQWLFFSQTHSTKVMRSVSDNIITDTQDILTSR